MNTIKKIIELSGTTQTAFAKRFNIPLRTIQAWCTEERECPRYIEQLLKSEVKRDNNLLDINSDEIKTIRIGIETDEKKNTIVYYDSISAAINAYNDTKIYAKDKDEPTTIYLILYIVYKDGITTDSIHLLSETV